MDKLLTSHLILAFVNPTIIGMAQLAFYVQMVNYGTQILDNVLALRTQIGVVIVV
jgi:hypothetical protein